MPLFPRFATPRTERIALTAIVAVALALRLFAISTPVLHPWDEAFHALTAKNLTHHPFTPTLYDDEALPHDDLEWTRSHLFLNKPPLALWTMAVSIAAFGVTPFAARLPTVFLDLGTVVLIWAIGRRLFSPRAGLLAAAMHALLGNALLLCAGVHATDHVDGQLMFWVTLGAFAVVGHRTSPGALGWVTLVGVAAGGGVLTKSAPGLLPLGLFALFAGGPRLWKTLFATATAFFIAAPWNLYLRATWPGPAAHASSSQLSHLWKVWEGHDGHPLFHLEKLGQLHGAFAITVIVLVIIRGLRTGERGLRLLATWWCVPFVVFSFSATKMPNYLALASPAIALCFGWLFELALENRRPLELTLAAGALATALWTDGREALRFISPTTGAAEFAAAMRALPPKTILLNSADPIAAMFFGAHAAYPELWPDSQQRHFESLGYRIEIARCGANALPPGHCVTE